MPFLQACRNPLKSGQCFLQKESLTNSALGERRHGRNPLKSGQCFLHISCLAMRLQKKMDMSQSPQIGSMFLT